MTALPTCDGCKDSSRPPSSVRTDIHWCQVGTASWRCLGKYPSPDRWCHNLERKPKE